MILHRLNKDSGAGVPENEVWRISRWRKVSTGLLMVVCGLLSSAALPPLNWSCLAFIAFVPLLLVTMYARMSYAWWSGVLFGWAWGFTAFHFLDEIQGSFGVIPYILATVLSLYFGVFAMVLSRFNCYIRCGRREREMSFSERAADPPRCGWLNDLAFVVLGSALYLMVEWGRAWALPWNFLAVTQYRIPELLQLASIGGSYLVGFTIIFVNFALAVSVDNAYRDFQSGRKRRLPWLFLLSCALIAGSGFYGMHRMRSFEYKETLPVKFGLIQCNISQRRSATVEEGIEALKINFSLLKELMTGEEKPDIVFFPESATPIPYSDSSGSAQLLRAQLFYALMTYNTPLLFGAIDIEEDPSGESDFLTFNRAMLFHPDHTGYAEKFDKIHRVPFGEYVPFRDFLPEFVIRIIDMHRDLTPGSDFTPLNLLPGVRAGVSICFEDVFPYIARREAQLGANLLAVITNDAWYPESAEPEQHYANCIMRTIESGLPMVRCGNNSASVVISPVGIAVDGVLRNADGTVDFLSKERIVGVVKCDVPLNPEPTVFLRFGDWFIYLMAVLSLAGCIWWLSEWSHDRRELAKRLNN